MRLTRFMRLMRLVRLMFGASRCTLGCISPRNRDFGGSMDASQRLLARFPKTSISQETKLNSADIDVFGKRAKSP